MAEAIEVTADTPIEYLYGTWQVENLDGYLVQQVEQFAIIKRTPKRVFYDAGYGRVRCVDRQVLEQTGSAYNRSAGAWAPDYQLFTNRADVEPEPPETHEAKVSRLRAAAAAAHPDRGGDPAEFRAAYARYRTAKDRQPVGAAL